MRAENATPAVVWRGHAPEARRAVSFLMRRLTGGATPCLWIAEAEPALSWLMLVSAMETAANHWRAGDEPPVDRLRASRPEIEQVLLEAGGAELVERVALQIAPYMGSTKKFIDFALAFLPGPPDARPDPSGRLSWERRAMKDAMRRVYSYRSRALHGGRPFPAPMCAPPMRFGDTDVPAEVPLGITMRTLGGTWRAKDVPIHLHTFEYIVRGALLGWWASMGSGLRQVASEPAPA